MTNKIPWYRTPLEKADLAMLTQRSDGKGLLQAGSFLLLYLLGIGSGIFLYTTNQWIPLIFVCYSHSILVNFMGWGAAVHELSHATVFRTKWLNEFFLYLFSLLSWNNPIYFRISHTNHHLYTLHDGLDREVLQVPVKKKLNMWNLLQWFTFDLFQFKHFLSRTILHALGKAEADYFTWNPLLDPSDPRRKSIVRWARFMLLFHIAIAIAAAITQLWILLYLVTFSFFFASFYTKFCGALQHTGLQANEPDWRLTTHTFEAGPLTSFLYWNINYHIEHHMYASIPFYNLPHLHKRIKPDLPVHPKSLFKGLLLLLKIRKAQKRNPSYSYIPEFPKTATPPQKQKTAHLDPLPIDTHGFLPDSRDFWKDFWQVNTVSLYGFMPDEAIDDLPIRPSFDRNKPRVPVLIELGEDWIIQKMGVSYRKYIQDGEYQQEVRSACAARLKQDLEFYLKPKVDTASLLHGSIYGNPIQYPEDSTPTLEPILHTVEDVKALMRRMEGIDLSQAGLVGEFVRRYQELGKPYRGRILHDPTSVHGPGTILGFLFGISEFIMFLYDEPDLSCALIDLVARITVRYSKLVRTLTQAPETGVGVFDDVAGLLSPELFERFLLPAYRTIYSELAPDPQDDRFLHNDAAVGHLLPYFRELGVNGINPDRETPPTLIRKELPQVILYGSIPPLLLRNGSPEEVFHAAKQCIEEVGMDGGLVLTTAGSINPGTPYENLLALCYASYKFGNFT